METQGYTLEHNILYQDNNSTILLVANRRMSSSKRTKHIQHRYFLVKDRVDQGDLDIKYCPTEEMWADVMTNRSRGSTLGG